MKLLVATDIWGLSAALRQALQQLPDIALKLEFAEPASAAGATFGDEQQAYQAFVATGGVPAYQALLTEKIRRHKPDILLGFSAGAAALWACSPQCADKSMLLVYGGQIRHDSALKPACRVHCLWTDESHFDVRALQSTLASTQNPNSFSQQHWPYGHGFVNPLSGHYDQAGAALFWQFCRSWLQLHAGNAS